MLDDGELRIPFLLDIETHGDWHLGLLLETERRWEVIILALFVFLLYEVDVQRPFNPGDHVDAAIGCFLALWKLLNVHVQDANGSNGANASSLLHTTSLICKFMC